jgi:hypothetical protein
VLLEKAIDDIRDEMFHLDSLSGGLPSSANSGEYRPDQVLPRDQYPMFGK